jgi:hypothetical protein
MGVRRLRLRRVWRVIDRWWWKPSALRMLMWMLVAGFASAAGGVGDREPGGRITFGKAVAVTVATIAIASVCIAGVRMIVNEIIVGPIRALLIRRATGRSVYFANGRLHERRRHARSAKKGSDELDRTG